MSMGANISIMGLYHNDDSIFDLMHVPSGFTTNDTDCVKNSILAECAELEILYPNPTVMKNMIGLWSYKELPYWQRIYDASLLEYNPIENYRRTETESVTDGRTEEHSGSDVNTSSGSDTLKKTGSDTSTDSGSDTLARTGTIENAAGGSDTSSGTSSTTYAESGTETTEHNISGFDSNTLVPNTSDATTFGKNEDTDSEAENSTTYGRTDTQTLNKEDETTYGKVNTQNHNTTDTTTYGKADTLQHGEKIEHSGTSERSVLAFGNIGVTTSQDMLTQEVEVAKIIQVIPIIVESFKNRFCLLVY